MGKTPTEFSGTRRLLSKQGAIQDPLCIANESKSSENLDLAALAQASSTVHAEPNQFHCNASLLYSSSCFSVKVEIHIC